MRHWYTYFTIRLHRLISQTYGSAGEIFETGKGATILTPKRVAGYDAAGGEIHIMPHQILLCLADMEFLLQLFLEKAAERPGEWGTARCGGRSLSLPNSEIFECCNHDSDHVQLRGKEEVEAGLGTRTKVSEYQANTKGSSEITQEISGL